MHRKCTTIGQRILPLGLVTAAVVLAGCGGGGSSSAGGGLTPSATGLQVSMTDAPGNFQHVNITISSVSAVDNQGNVQVVNSQPQTFDLLALQNNVDKVIGTASLPPGQYSQIRLNVTSANVVDSSGVTHALTVPSGAQTGIKLVDNFTISATQLTSITLDFNAAQSIVTTGNANSPQGIKYLLKPVIKVVAQVVSGQIGGIVQDAATSQPIAATSNPLVTAYPAGSPTDGSIPASATAVPSATDGTFTLTRLTAGSYDLYYTAEGYTTQTMTGVSVSANTTTSETSVSLTPVPAAPAPPPP